MSPGQAQQILNKGLGLQLEEGPGPHAVIYQWGDPLTLQASVLASGKWVHCEE